MWHFYLIKSQVALNKVSFQKNALAGGPYVDR